MKKYSAEVFGTIGLVFCGTGANEMELTAGMAILSCKSVKENECWSLPAPFCKSNN